VIAPEVLDALLAHGATAEMIVAAVKADNAIAEQAVEMRRTKDRERQRRHRSSRDVTATNGDTVTEPCPLTPPLKSAPHPTKITPPLSPNPPMKRAHRLPSDWLPAPLTGKAAEMVACWLPGELERELAKFRNYWMGKAGKDAAKLDWQRTWINWLISADERKPRNDQRSVSRNRPNLTDLHRAATAASRDLEDRGRAGPALPAIGHG
jgi:hypothetical protein